MNPERAALARAYEDAAYTVEFPTGRIEFRIGKSPKGPVPEGTLAIITAWNPGLRRPGERENREANERLRAALREGGWTFHPASGHDADGSHEEPSFAVLRIDARSALDLARRFGQAAIVFWDGAFARLLWCDES